MEAELVALATAGATALVQQMVTDSWSHASERVAAFFSRGGAAVDEETVEGELEVSRAELAAAREAGDEQAVSDVEAEWRTRLRRALQADPALAEELRVLLEELTPGEAGPGQGAVHNTVSGKMHGNVVQARTISSVHFGERS